MLNYGLFWYVAECRPKRELAPEGQVAGRVIGVRKLPERTWREMKTLVRTRCVPISEMENQSPVFHAVQLGLRSPHAPRVTRRDGESQEKRQTRRGSGK